MEDAASADSAPMDISAILASVSELLDTTVVVLSKDRRASRSKFPLDTLQAGREKGISNMGKFDAVDSLWEYDGQVFDMIWIDECRGDEVRS